MHFDIGFELLHSMEMKCVHNTVIQHYFHKSLEHNCFFVNLNIFKMSNCFQFWIFVAILNLTQNYFSKSAIKFCGVRRIKMLREAY
jgi:hypothetical protein